MGAVQVIPLGGLGEIGMNALALVSGDEAIVVDCGVTFDDRGLGVDVVHPDFSALDAYRVQGVILTHGHEDHIGALPYFLRRFDVPVWGPPYALGLVRARLEEHEVLGWAKLFETSPRKPFQAGPFQIEPIRVTHSIADATALAIDTPAGRLVHSGDFKFDEDPVDGEAFDEERLRALGDEGVALLMSDSTNIDARGDAAGTERGVGDALQGIVEDATGAVVVAMFASNVHRLRMLGQIAAATNRRLIVLGRSVETHARVAHATGYLDWPSEVTWPAARVNELPRSRILGVATGTQGEPRAALARLARGEHPSLAIARGDTVILSSRVIPGHEPEVYALMGDLLRRGAELRTWISDRGVHVSGHAHAGEQRRMIELVRPRAFMPLHGTLHHLHRHADLARACGVGSVSVLENGDVGVLEDGGLSKRGRVTSGRVYRQAGREVQQVVIREREALARDGVALVVISLDAASELSGPIEIATRGVAPTGAEGSHLAAARAAVTEAIAQLPRSPGVPLQETAVAEAARLAVRRALSRALGFKPLTVVQVVRIGG